MIFFFFFYNVFHPSHTLHTCTNFDRYKEFLKYIPPKIEFRISQTRTAPHHYFARRQVETRDGKSPLACCNNIVGIYQTLFGAIHRYIVVEIIIIKLHVVRFCIKIYYYSNKCTGRYVNSYYIFCLSRKFSKRRPRELHAARISVLWYKYDIVVRSSVYYTASNGTRIFFFFTES